MLRIVANVKINPTAICEAVFAVDIINGLHFGSGYDAIEAQLR